MNIEGLGEKLTEQFVDKGLVKNVADIYYLISISYPVPGGRSRVPPCSS